MSDFIIILFFRCEFLDFEKIIDLLDEKLKSDDYRVQMVRYASSKLLHLFILGKKNDEISSIYLFPLE